MTQFHEGQEVEVWCFPDGEWEKAKIIGSRPFDVEGYWVKFRDGTHATFKDEHIRAPRPYEEGHAAFEASRVRK